jgi:hypothetical protein
LNRDQKAAAIEEIAVQIRESDAVFAVDYRGISVPQAAELRTSLAGRDATFRSQEHADRARRRPARSRGPQGASSRPDALTFVRATSRGAPRPSRTTSAGRPAALQGRPLNGPVKRRSSPRSRGSRRATCSTGSSSGSSPRRSPAWPAPERLHRGWPSRCPRSTRRSSPGSPGGRRRRRPPPRPRRARRAPRPRRPGRDAGRHEHERRPGRRGPRGPDDQRRPGRRRRRRIRNPHRLPGELNMATSTDAWIDELKSISVLELSERIKALEETFGVSAAAVAAPAAVAGAAATPARPRRSRPPSTSSSPPRATRRSRSSRSSARRPASASRRPRRSSTRPRRRSRRASSATRPTSSRPSSRRPAARWSSSSSLADPRCARGVLRGAPRAFGRAARRPLRVPRPRDAASASQRPARPPRGDARGNLAAGVDRAAAPSSE